MLSFPRLRTVIRQISYYVEKTPHARSAANLVYYRWRIRSPSTKMGIGIGPGTMFFTKERNCRDKKKDMRFGMIRAFWNGELDGLEIRRVCGCCSKAASLAAFLRTI